MSIGESAIRRCAIKPGKNEENERQKWETEKKTKMPFLRESGFEKNLKGDLAVHKKKMRKKIRIGDILS